MFLIVIDFMSSYYDVDGGRKRNKLGQALLNGASICMVRRIASYDIDYFTHFPSSFLEESNNS